MTGRVRIPLTVVLLLLGWTGSSQPQSLVTNGFFESSEGPKIGWPFVFGNWGGDKSEIVGISHGVTPFEGSQMLRFIYADFAHALSIRTSSDIYQLINISSFQDDISTGLVMATASAYFNRVMGDAQTDSQFDVGLFALKGPLSGFTSQIINGTYLAGSRTLLTTDSDIATWELSQFQLLLPGDAEFLALHIGAQENIFNDGPGGVEFDGHFADGVALNLSLIPEPSTFALLGIGLLALFAIHRKRKKTNELS